VTNLERKEALIKCLRLQVDLNDWKQVRKIAKDLRKLEQQVHQVRAPIKDEGKAQAPSTEALPDVMPRDVEIPHNIQEVRNLLRMKDEDLIEKLFPIETPEQEAGA
jgi:hypothetical protein